MNLGEGGYTAAAPCMETIIRISYKEECYLFTTNIRTHKSKININIVAVFGLRLQATVLFSVYFLIASMNLLIAL